MALRMKAVGLAVALTLTVPVLAATPADAATTTTAPTAAGWLTEQFTAGTHLQTPFGGTYYDDYGLTADAVLALDAAKVGQNYAVAATTWLTQHVTDYVGDGTTDSYAGPLAKLALVAQAQGLDPTNFGGRNLLTALEARQSSTTGRFSDKSAYGDYSNAITQSLAVIAERRAGRSSAIVARGLTSLYSLQCTDHGFALNYEDADQGTLAPCTSTTGPKPSSNLTDNDATSYAVQAGIDQTHGGRIPTQISQALDYLLSAQASATGELPEQNGAEGNTNSTGLAAVAFAVGGRTGMFSDANNTGAKGASAFVAALQQRGSAPDTRIGAVAYSFPGFDLATALRATPQAIFGLAEWDGAGADKNASYELISKTGAGTTVPIPAKATGSFVTITPARLLDTRQSAAVPAGATLTVGVGGHAGVPADASAATVNITAVTPTGTGNVAAYPTGGARPTTSVLNLITGQTVAGSTLVTLGATGAISLINNSNHPLQLIVDVTGYTRAGAGRAAGAYRTVDPTRLLDTRKTTPVPALASVDVTVHGSSVDASSDAAAAAITVTAVSAAGPGNLVAYRSGGARPTTSTVNLISGQTVANSAVVQLGSNGKITVHNNSNKAVNVLVDITGYFVNGTPTLSGTFVPVPPARLLDTRTGGAIAALGIRPVTVTGVAGIPAGGASTVFGNITGVVPTGPGYLVTYPASGSRPVTSSVNLFPGQTVANFSVTTIGANGQIVVGNQSQKAVNALFDVAGYVRT